MFFTCVCSCVNWEENKIQHQHPCYALSEKSILQRKKQANMMAISETAPARLFIKDFIYFFIFFKKERARGRERRRESLLLRQLAVRFCNSEAPTAQEQHGGGASVSRTHKQLRASSAKSEEAREKEREKKKKRYCSEVIRKTATHSDLQELSICSRSLA